MPFTDDTIPTYATERLRAAKLTQERDALEEVANAGIIKRHRRTTTSTTTTTEVGVIRFDDVPVVGGRLYHIYTSTLQLASSVNNDGLAANLRYTEDGSTPSTSSTVMTSFRDQQVNATTGFTGMISVMYAPASDLELSLLLTVARITGTGNAQMSGSATFPIDLVIEDIGIDPGSTGTNI
jgi:hypothetical protein